jgi:hypothetical protein
VSSQVQELIAKKNYAKALDAVKADLAKRPKDQRLRLQQADVLILAGRDKEAVPVLLGLADEHAADGFAAKAIAVLKRIEKIAPGRRDVEDRLAHLIQEKVRSTPSAPARPAGGFEIGLEEIDSSGEIGMGSPSLGLEAPSEPELSLGSAEPEPVPEVLPEIAPEPVADSDLEGLDYVAAAEAEPAASAGLSTPLFEGMSQEELVEVMRGLQLRSFEAGDVLVAEGAPGDSLFIITTGTVKCWVRDRKGHYMKVQELPEGAFFGEIALLTGKPRTATITAGSQVEVLELDKKTFDEITRQHPHVHEVVKKFQEKRAMDTVQAIMKKK